MNHLNKSEINVWVPVSEILSFHCPVTLLSTGFFCGPRACFTQQRTDSVISESILFTKSKSFQGSCAKFTKKKAVSNPKLANLKPTLIKQTNGELYEQGVIIMCDYNNLFLVPKFAFYSHTGLWIASLVRPVYHHHYHQGLITKAIVWCQQ